MGRLLRVGGIAVTVAAVVGLSGCASPTASPAPAPVTGKGDTGAPTVVVPEVSTAADASGTGPTSKVLVVVEENHAAAAALQQMPYLAGLAAQFGQTGDYRAIAHPSLPNYLAIAGGSTFGVADDRAPASHPISQLSVFDQALMAGRTARTYAEAMPQACALTSDGRYAVKHNPWAYFSSAVSRSNCQRFDVPAGTPGFVNVGWPHHVRFGWLHPWARLV